MYRIEFGETLKELIDERKITVKQFAAEIGVAAPTISRYIRGKRMPDINNLVLIADYFNCSTDFLLSREPYVPNLKYKKCPPFCEQIKFLARYNCKTYDEFYTKAEIHESTFYEWKCGSSIPTLESIIRIADKFDYRIDFILGRES